MEAVVTNVTERTAGSELAADYSASDATLTVVNPDEFDADGGVLQIGTETSAYSIDTDTGACTLKTPLASSYSEGEPVTVYPPHVERLAYVREAGNGEEMEVRVPHTLKDRLPLGTRDDSEPELVEFDLRGHELIATDIIGKGLTNYAEALDEENTTSTTADDLGGPEVSIDVGSGALVSVFASVEIKANGGGQGDVLLYQDGSPLGNIVESVAGAYVELMTSLGALGAQMPFATPLTFPVDPGVHTFSLQYTRTGGTSADFRNRKLWVWVNKSGF